ncbi:hypothetical protein NUU61_001865 [Penicillium alfredii]|uniref:Uncharacterized protein n=1 Tax=Penicillium alfredii TaxID=1506179 RepID=A0A9W9KGA6_9EURO|nr:uncharacterized protein NUU61_001865 [Penicillium alfredii]KAJ5104518.1 hypothetical protein NUU61_001865 [Penicillium alfredii]
MLHPKACSPPNIPSYKGFMEFVARGMKGRIGKTPTVGTIEGFRRDFEAGLVLRRDYKTPENGTSHLLSLSRRPPPVLEQNDGRLLGLFHYISGGVLLAWL